eukprot:9501653-Pyramimonas_sp.AAC.1
MGGIGSIRQRALLECGRGSRRHVQIARFDARSLMILNRLERAVSDMAKARPDLPWIALSGAPTTAMYNRERRAWNVAQLMMEALKISCD